MYGKNSFLLLHPVFFGDVSVVSVHGELLGHEVGGVAVVAEQLFVVLVQGARVQRDPAHDALDAAAVVWLAVSRHHLQKIYIGKNVSLVRVAVVIDSCLT